MQSPDAATGQLLHGFQLEIDAQRRKIPDYSSLKLFTGMIMPFFKRRHSFVQQDSEHISQEVEKLLKRSGVIL
jgi:hypothetical protein